MSLVPMVTIILPPRLWKAPRSGLVESSIAEISLRARVQRAAFDVVERVRREVLHQEAGDAQHAKVRVDRRGLARAFLASDIACSR